MNEEYLWDRSGEPDPEVERLEQLLLPLRGRAGTPPAPAKPRPIWLVPLAAGVLLAAAIGLSWTPIPEAGWQVTGMGSGQGQLRRGDRLVTGAQETAHLERDELGKVTVAPGSELSVSNRNRDELQLKRGKIEAFIWAPPGKFLVDTPSARTIDLGCAYTLEVQPDGSGMVHVSMGWVAFEGAGKEAFIPAGAQCRTKRGAGPGIPAYEDAKPEFLAEVGQFEGGREAGATGALPFARERDAMTLWHLLRRAQAADRGVIFDRIAELRGIPAGITRSGVVAQDPRMLDALWDSFDLGDSKFWREWKRELR